MIRIIIDVPTEEVKAWVLSFLALIEIRLKCAIPYSVKELRAEAQSRVGQARVQYVALAGLEVLKDLGERTMVGLVFAHIYESGPITAKEIEQAKCMKKKTVESNIHALRHMGLVGTRDISEVKAEGEG